MRGFARESHLNVWYERLNASELVARFGGRLGPKGRLLFSKPFAKARRKTSLRALAKLTERVEGELRFRSAPPLLVPLRELFEGPEAREENAFIYELLEKYADSLAPDRRHLFATYRFVDMARKVVGVGSVGTRAWVFLFVDRASRDPLILQAKEAQASVMEPYLGTSEFANHGERVVRGQRISMVASDIFLSWQRSRGPRRRGARLLRPPTLGLEGVRRPIDDERVGPARLRARLWLVAGTNARTLRRPARYSRVPRRRSKLRQGTRAVLCRVRRPERARLRPPCTGGQRRRGSSRVRGLRGTGSPTAVPANADRLVCRDEDAPSAGHAVG